MARIAVKPPDGRQNRIEAWQRRIPKPMPDVRYEAARFTIRLAVESGVLRIEGAAKAADIASPTMLTAVCGVRTPNAGTRQKICRYAERLRGIGILSLRNQRKEVSYER